MSGFTVHIVDDEPLITNMIKYNLNKNGVEYVKIFSSGNEYLQLEKSTPDLLILDYQLDDMNGLDLLKRIKKSSPTANIIILSGEESSEISKKCRDCGALDFIVKSTKAVDQILQRIKALIRFRE